MEQITYIISPRRNLSGECSDFHTTAQKVADTFTGAEFISLFGAHTGRVDAEGGRYR